MSYSTITNFLCQQPKEKERWEGDRIKAKKMRDVNKVDALFVEEIPIIFPSETSLEITPPEIALLLGEVYACTKKRSLTSNTCLPFCFPQRGIIFSSTSLNRSPRAAQWTHFCLLTKQGCYLNFLV